MSRTYCSYDEEWQRKRLIKRSLFHDIPKPNPDYRQVTVKAMVHIDGSQGNEDRESDKESVRSIIHPARFKMVPSRKVDERIGGLAALEEKEEPNPDYRQVTVKAMVHIDGSQGNEDRESDEESVRSIILPAGFKMVPSRKVDERIGGLAALEEKEEPNPDYRQVTVKAMVHIDGSQGNEDRESDEESVRSIILPAGFKMVPSRKVDERIGGLAALEEKEEPNPDYRQVTVKAMVHIDGSQGNEDRESDEESVRSIILPARFKMVPSRKVDERIGGLAALEEKEDPNTAPIFDSDQEETTDEDLEEVATHQLATPETAEEIITDQPEAANEETGTHQPVINMDEDGEAPNEDMESPHPFEVMRTPRPDLSHRIPIRHESSSRSTGELAAVPRHTTAIMSSSQDEVGSNVSEIQTSNDMNENINSIFNESKIEASGRKRKLIDKSVQTVPTSMVSWDEIRSNFFVGTPKIFRLCD